MVALLLHAALLLASTFAPTTAAAPPPHDPATADEVAQVARQLPAGTAIDDALRFVRVGRHTHGSRSSTVAGIAREPGPALAALGFRTALDLQLLAGGPEAAELMAELRTTVGISIADRAKVRLLIGDREHLRRLMRSDTQMSASVDDCHRSDPEAMTQLRQLQDENRGGMSVDTIGSTALYCPKYSAQNVSILPLNGLFAAAIVFSVLVGTGGYLLQALTAHRASRHAAHLQREHDQETRLQKMDHERTQAQMRRTDRWVLDCCEPVDQALAQYAWSRFKFVIAFAMKTQENEQNFAEIYESYSMKHLDVKSDGTISLRSKILFDPSIETMYPTESASTVFNSMLMGGSVEITDIFTQEFFVVNSEMYIRELPQAFFDLLASDPTSTLAEEYRSYIRHEVKPALELIKETLYTHFAAVEVPPWEWLVETFPGNDNSIDSPVHIVYNQVSYSRAWDRVLAEWDAGYVNIIYPSSHMNPCYALKLLIRWSRKRGEDKQTELIGMSSGWKRNLVWDDFE